MINQNVGTNVPVAAARFLFPVAIACTLGACATAPAHMPPLTAVLPLVIESGDTLDYQPPTNSPTAFIRFERPQDIESNLANVHLDNERCAGRREFVGEPDSDNFYGDIAAGREITLSTWSDATWVGPHQFDIEFCNAIFTFTPDPGAEYLIARPILKRDCQVDVFRSDGAPVAVQMRQPAGAESDNGAWCQARGPGIGEHQKPEKLLVNLPAGKTAAALTEL